MLPRVKLSLAPIVYSNGNYALGNERFKAEVSRMLQRRITSGKAGRPATPD